MTRQCGDCQLCCKLLPVKSLAKLAGQRCSHQKHHKGCAVYKQLGRVSPECRLWNCRWLVADDTAELSRPDRSHYVLDLMPDFRAYLERRAEQNVIGLVRWDNEQAMAIFPPALSEDGRWHEQGSKFLTKGHTVEEKIAALGAMTMHIAERA